MVYKQRRRVTATPILSSLSLDGERFGNGLKTVQEPGRKFFEGLPGTRR
jgi:hypothetical protein